MVTTLDVSELRSSTLDHEVSQSKADKLNDSPSVTLNLSPFHH